MNNVGVSPRISRITLSKPFLLLSSVIFIALLAFVFLAGRSRTLRSLNLSFAEDGKVEKKKRCSEVSFTNSPPARSDSELEKYLHKRLNLLTFSCKSKRRLGHPGEGGWTACTDEPFKPVKPCLVYSFGISNDWTFDDDVRANFSCTVFSFDPFIGAKAHKRATGHWFHPLGISDGEHETGYAVRNRMSTLSAIRRLVKTNETTIDVLKMDVEWSEWPSIRAMIRDGDLSSVKQLLWEAHLYFSPDAHKIRQMTEVLDGLQNLGFRVFFTSPNVFRYTSRLQPGVVYWDFYNIGMVNVNFIPKSKG